MNTAAEIMRDYIVLDAIPELTKLGRTKLVDSLNVAVGLGDANYQELPAYWEGIRLFASNGLHLAKLEIAMEKKNA